MGGAAKPAEGRKRLQLKPRTKPLDAPAPEPARNASIFGGGRPHDDLEYEVGARRKHIWGAVGERKWSCSSSSLLILL